MFPFGGRLLEAPVEEWSFRSKSLVQALAAPEHIRCARP